MYYPDRDPHYPDRDPYNKYGVNSGYDDGYPSEQRRRDDGFRRSSRRNDDRRVSSRHHTHVPYTQDERYKTAPDRDHVSNADMSEPRDVFSKSTSGGDGRGKALVGLIIAFCLLLFLVLGAMAVGGVALYYAHFDTLTDTYKARIWFQDDSLTSGMILPSSDAFKTQETKFCKGMKAVCGGELKSCEVDFLFADKTDGVSLEGRLHFYRSKLEIAAKDIGESGTYVTGRLNYACYTKFICDNFMAEPFPKRVGFTLKNNISTATPKIEYRNNTDYYKAQESVCNAIEIALANVYINCYVVSFNTNNGIHVIIDANEVRDELKKDTVFLKTLKTLKETGVSQQPFVTKLINKSGQKLIFFKDFVLKVEYDDDSTTQ